MIECQDIYSSHKSSLNRPILNGISLKINPGESVALLGPNGAGKSSLLKAMVGLVSIEKGEIQVNGRKITPKSLPYVRSQMGMIWQGGGLIPQLSALDNVLCGRLGKISSWSSLGGFPKGDRQRAQTLLSELGLAGQSQEKVSKLSGGQQQRVAIARALMTSPPILLADEPTSGLDVVVTQQVMAILMALHQGGVTLVLVLHDLAMARQYTDRAIILEQGRIIFDGKSDNIEQEYNQL